MFKEILVISMLVIFNLTVTLIMTLSVWHSVFHLLIIDFITWGKVIYGYHADTDLVASLSLQLCYIINSSLDHNNGMYHIQVKV